MPTALEVGISSAVPAEFALIVNVQEFENEFGEFGEPKVNVTDWLAPSVICADASLWPARIESGGGVVQPITPTNESLWVLGGFFAW